MLSELKIKNFAIIDNLTIDFSQGLTVITGETGAGKSMIVDALNILIGHRSSVDFIRHGTKQAEIQGLFTFNDKNHPALQIAVEQDIDIEDNELIFRRIVGLNGKSRCYLNGTLVKVAILKEIGLKVLDIHGQHEHQELMNNAVHINLLDQFSNGSIEKYLKTYQKTFRLYQQAKKKLADIKQKKEINEQKMELLQFQVAEIELADFFDNEEEELVAEKTILLNYEKIVHNLQSAYNSLQGDGDYGGMHRLHEVLNNLNVVAEYDEKYREMQERCAEAYYTLEDIQNDVSKSLENFYFDEGRLVEIEERLSLLQDFKRKYGNTIGEIFSFKSKAEEQIKMYEQQREDREGLTISISQYENELIDKANKLTTMRKKVADQLEMMIHTELRELYMDKAQFKVMFVQEPALTFQGQEQIEFYISSNPGEPLKAISKIASGGELSRIMLAIKSIFTRHQAEKLVIFDEIDTGVSGRVAQAIAEKMYSLANYNQIFAISHLPQVAVMADIHLFIEKEQKENTTKTKLKTLTENERVVEIGHMISGSDINMHTEEHIRTMFGKAKEIKK